MIIGAPGRSGQLAGRYESRLELLGPLRRALMRSTQALELLPSHTPMLPKVLGECAMLVHAAAPLRGAAPWLRDAVDLLATRVAAGTRTRENAVRILLEPAYALDHACAHLLLAAAGYPDVAFHRHVVAAVSPDYGGRDGPERLPHRELEQLFLGRMSGLAENDAEAPVLASSALGRPLDPLSATRLDAYAFTHCVMYAHDLGGRHLRLPRPPEQVLADAEAGPALAMDAADLDLAVELLMTWPLMGAGLGPVAGHVLEHVLEVESRLGFLPGLGFDAAHNEVTTLLANYHPATVMGIFAALAIRADTEMSPPRAADASRLAALVGAWPGPIPPWVEETVGRAPSAGAEPLLLNAALRTAVARTDLHAVRALLVVALDHDLARGPAVTAATALLIRVSRGVPA